MPNDPNFRVTRSPVPLPDDIAADEQPFAPYPGSGRGPLIPGSGSGPYYGGQAGTDNFIRSIRGSFLQMPFTVGVAAIQLLPEEKERCYFFMLNYDAANTIFIGFDTNPPTAVNGVTLAANLGFYEPWIIPTNAIFVAASGAGTQGMLVRVLHK